CCAAIFCFLVLSVRSLLFCIFGLTVLASAWLGLSCPVLSCPVLSCPVLSFLVFTPLLPPSLSTVNHTRINSRATRTTLTLPYSLYNPTFQTPSTTYQTLG
ncbi:unnamed protein product, partial [Laminaria digitata]